MLDVGRVCLKTAGREAGRYCIIVKKMDENFVLVTGPRELTSVKRRRCNINHLEPLMESLKIKSDAPDSEVLKAFQQANLVKKLGLEPEKPGTEKAKPGKEVKEKPKEARKEKKAVKKEPKKESKKPAKKASPKKKKK